MKTHLFGLLVALGLLLVACTAQPDAETPESKRARLAELKTKLAELKTQINQLESELASVDRAFAAANRRSVLVTTVPAQRGRFVRYVEANATVESKTNLVVSPELAGVIRELLVREGQTVAAGQTLARLDDALIRSQIDELKTSLSLATTVLEKRERLWQQKIGTELQYLEAKTNKESLERSIRTLETQLAKTIVKAPIAGRVEEVFTRSGELGQPGLPILRLVSSADMNLKADLSEAYLNKFRPGDSARVFFPEFNREFVSRVRTVGTLINPTNRTFPVEIYLPNDPLLNKPGLMAVISLKEYDDPVAITVPSHLIQQDLKGEFVYILNQNGSQMMAQKVRIKRGQSYKNRTVIEEGLVGHEQLIDEGFREVVDGANVRLQQAETTVPQATLQR
jgi:RND family efflux transporter MFP subunit